MWILRQTRRFVPPCLRRRRANSPPDCFLTHLHPLILDLDLDVGAVDQQVQRAVRSTIGNVHRSRVFWRRDSVLKSGTAQSGPINPGRLSTNPVSAAATPCRTEPSSPGRSEWPHRCSRAGGRVCRSVQPPGHGGIEPDRQRAAALERCVVTGPVPGLVARGRRSAHAIQISRWIRMMDPLKPFVQQSPSTCNRCWIISGSLPDRCRARAGRHPARAPLP